MKNAPNPVFVEARLIRELGPWYNELAVHLTYTEDKACAFVTHDSDVRIPVSLETATALLEAMLAAITDEEDSDA